MNLLTALFAQIHCFMIFQIAIYIIITRYPNHKSELASHLNTDNSERFDIKINGSFGLGNYLVFVLHPLLVREGEARREAKLNRKK